MKKIIFIAAVFQTFALTNSFASEQIIDIRKANQEIAEKILGTVGGCGERIWPGYDLKNLNVVLFDDVSEELLAVSIKENRIFKINMSEFPASVEQSSYAFFSIKNQNWMSINAEKYTSGNKKRTQELLVSKSYRLAIHESFHHTTQRAWNKSTEGARGTFVPIKWEPRYYRAMIYKNLVSAYNDKNNSELSLRRAKYWYEKWSKEFPEEVLSTTDGYEGTAKYSDIMAEALTNLTCNAKEEDLNSYIRKIPNASGVDGMLKGYGFALDTEGYAIGSFAALILRRDKMNSNWQELIAKGQTPLAILMQNIQGQFQNIDEEFKSGFLETQKHEQSKAEGYLGDVYENLKQNDSYFVSVPDAWLGDGSGSYSFIGFYIDPSLNLDFSVLGEPFKFTSDDKQSTLESAEGAVYHFSLESSCIKNAGWTFITSSKSVFIESSNIMNINSEKFIGRLSGKLIKDQNGKNWFCAGEE